eukprot:COSAG02_NODE_877_length_16272_cov_8.002288_11_plen_103_part_00
MLSRRGAGNSSSAHNCIGSASVYFPVPHPRLTPSSAPPVRTGAADLTYNGRCTISRDSATVRPRYFREAAATEAALRPRPLEASKNDITGYRYRRYGSTEVF